MSNGGFCPERLGRMNAVMAGFIERGEVPGLVTALCRHGDVHVHVAGAAAIGGPPVQRDTIFRISSMTKPVTAVAAMILVEEGRLRLDDPVDGLLPELAGRRVLRGLDSPLDDTVPARRPITLRDLLTFRMGMGIVLAPPGTFPIQSAMDDLQLGQGMPAPQAVPEPDEWIRRLGTLPLMHQPGEKWMYGTGCDVLGVLIARAAGQPFQSFLRERIFQPLGMRDTAFSVPAEKVGRFATSYWNDPVTEACATYDPATGGQWNTEPAFAAGGAGLVSTADDFMAFGRMMIQNGKLGDVRILSRPTVELMAADQLTPDQAHAAGVFLGGNRGWGLGQAVATRRCGIAEPVGAYGWDGGLGTSWRNTPSENMVAILMTQRAWTSPAAPPVCQDFHTLAAQAIDN